MNPSNSSNQSTSAGMLQDANFPSGIIKPRHLAASTVMAAGDTYFVNSSGIFQRLAAGTTGQILVMTSGAPTWQTVKPQSSSITIAGVSTTASTSYVDLTSLAITTGVTCNIQVTIVASLTSNNGTNNNLSKLLRGSTLIGGTDIYMQPSTTAGVGHSFSYTAMDLAVAAGTYTYHWQWKVSAGTGSITDPFLILTALPV